MCEVPCNLFLGKGEDRAGVAIVEAVEAIGLAEVDLELALEEQVEELVAAQVELVVAQVFLLDLVEVVGASFEQGPGQEADAQRVCKVQSSQTGILEDSQVPQ